MKECLAGIMKLDSTLEETYPLLRPNPSEKLLPPFMYRYIDGLSSGLWGLS